MLTMAVICIASSERSFSKLKLVLRISALIKCFDIQQKKNK